MAGAKEQRRFHRILFDATASLSGKGNIWPARLYDLSLNGALTEHPDDCDVAKGDHLNLHVALDDHGTGIDMETEVVHITADRMGLKCVRIDVDSITRLRRLVELNLGDIDMLDRELTALMKAEFS